MTRQRHICSSCHRLLPAYDFPHHDRSGGWTDAEGIRRRSECRTCKRQRDNSRHHGVPFQPVERTWDEAEIHLEPVRSARVPAAPFGEWLDRKYRQWLRQGGSVEEFAMHVGLNQRAVERYRRREYPTVNWATVDQVLVNEGSTDLWELYGELYPRDEDVAA